MKEEGVTAYPLAWPAQYPRAKHLRTSAFDKHPFGRCRNTLKRELTNLGAKQIVLSSNVPLKQDGDPYARFGTIEDRGVAVYFVYKGKTTVLACDTYDRIECNVWAIQKTVNYLRAIDRYGVSDFLASAFAGFKALPPGRGAEPPPTCWEILRITKPTATLESLRRAYAAVLREAHPDTSIDGNAEKVERVTRAFDECVRELVP